jgi:hypothetical protein
LGRPRDDQAKAQFVVFVVVVLVVVVVVLVGGGVIAAALLAAALASEAAAVALEAAALASEAAAAVAFAASVLFWEGWHAVMPRAEMAAPAIMILRSILEVMVLVPLGEIVGATVFADGVSCLFDAVDAPTAKLQTAQARDRSDFLAFFRTVSV